MKALEELRSIIKLPNELLREEQLQLWTERWIKDLEFSQDVVDTKYLTSEYNDTIKIRMAQIMAEDLAEDCVSFKTEKKRISGTMLAFRRKAAKK